MAYRVLLDASTQPTLQPADEPSVAVAATPPKKRRFASAWAKTLRNPLEIDPNEGPLVRSNSSTVANAMPRDVKDVDDEFDRQFELPQKYRHSSALEAPSRLRRVPTVALQLSRLQAESSIAIL